MIEFTYVIGGNIVLFVKANPIPDDPETNFEGGAEIVSVALADGYAVEIDHLLIISNQGKPEKLEDLLIEEALTCE